jgi:dTDP-glucose 4,6-dehydratase
MILVTGGCGFIGSNFIRKYHNKDIICLDKLTYAANYESLKSYVENGIVDFYHGDIADINVLNWISKNYKITHIINFAAESHVDNSIKDYSPFIDTNIKGTINLLEWARSLKTLEKFIHISTDEVYGSLELDEERSFTELSHYETNSPYSASKAASDCFVRAFHKTYDVPAIITNCSNNYGPFQHEEKFIPTIINSIKDDKKIPVYGDGLNIRDWLYVEDHCDAINLVLEKGVIGEKYNIGGGEEVCNIELVKLILDKMNKPYETIEYIKDRPGHDRRFSIDCSKIERELGYKPQYTLEQGIEKTLGWYNGN